MSSTELIGNFNPPEASAARTRLRLSVPVNDLVLDWRRYNLVANYIGEYSAYYFEHKDKAENLISSVLYELLERVAAGSRHEARLDIQFSTADRWMIIDLASSFSREEVAKLRENLTELLESDIDSFYPRLLQQDADAVANRRILGLALVAHDYHARLSAALEPATGSTVLRALLSQEEAGT